MRTSILALLWENWRLTRVEAAWKLALGLVGGLAVLVVFAAFAPNKNFRDFGAVVAFVVIALPNIIGWVSIPKINGGRAGFPFSLNYTHPVPTAALVGVPMTYQVAIPAASYFVSAFLLRAASGYPFPLLPVAGWIAALNLAYMPTNWAIPNRLVALLGSLAAGLSWMGFVNHRLNSHADGFDWHDSPSLWPAIFDVPLTDYMLIAAIGLASFGLTVAGVTRQRHGDTRAPIPWLGTGFPEWLVNLFRIPCPTSSATKAQVWFELRSRGLPILAVGAALAVLNPLLFAVSARAGEWLRLIALMSGMFSLVGVLILSGNAFGMRWKPGRVYASAFEGTQPYGTAQLAGLKVLVRSVCVLAAFLAVSASVWASLAFIAVGEDYEPLKGYQPLRSWQQAAGSAIGAMSGYEQVALVIVAFIGVAVMVAWLSAFSALRARYPGRLNIAGLLLLLHGLVLVPLVMTGYRGVGSQELWELLVRVLVWITRWIDTPVIVLATIYVAWSAFAERLLTLRSASVAALVCVAFGAAWVTTLNAAGVQLAGMPATHVFWMLSPALLPLMVSVLAPWSLSRVRHT